jgi:acetolactate synthase-1/2/3 large subunit
MAGKQMEMTGAEMVLQALKDNGVEHIFGYPGGAVLPIYDELHQQDDDRAHPCAPRAGRRPHG